MARRQGRNAEMRGKVPSKLNYRYLTVLQTVYSFHHQKHNNNIALSSTPAPINFVGTALLRLLKECDCSALPRHISFAEYRSFVEAWSISCHNHENLALIARYRPCTVTSQVYFIWRCKQTCCTVPIGVADQNLRKLRGVPY